jgi:hypothetical protein
VNPVYYEKYEKIDVYIKYPGNDKYAIRNILAANTNSFDKDVKGSVYIYNDPHISENTSGVIVYSQIYNGFMTNSSYVIFVEKGFITEIIDRSIPIVNPSPVPVVTPQMYEEIYKMLEKIVEEYGSGKWIIKSDEFETTAKYDILNDKYYIAANVPYCGTSDLTYPDGPCALATVRYYLN